MSSLTTLLIAPWSFVLTRFTGGTRPYSFPRYGTDLHRYSVFTVLRALKRFSGLCNATGPSRNGGHGSLCISGSNETSPVSNGSARTGSRGEHWFSLVFGLGLVRRMSPPWPAVHECSSRSPQPNGLRRTLGETENRRTPCCFGPESLQQAVLRSKSSTSLTSPGLSQRAIRRWQTQAATAPFFAHSRGFWFLGEQSSVIHTHKKPVWKNIARPI